MQALPALIAEAPPGRTVAEPLLARTVATPPGRTVGEPLARVEAQLEPTPAGAPMPGGRRPAGG
jgi:hypothetical protein